MNKIHVHYIIDNKITYIPVNVPTIYIVTYILFHIPNT